VVVTAEAVVVVCAETVVVVTSGAVVVVGAGPMDIAVSIVGAGVVASHESSSDTSRL